MLRARPSYCSRLLGVTDTWLVPTASRPFSRTSGSKRPCTLMSAPKMSAMMAVYCSCVRRRTVAGPPDDAGPSSPQLESPISARPVQARSASVLPTIVIRLSARGRSASARRGLLGRAVRRRGLVALLLLRMDEEGRHRVDRVGGRDRRAFAGLRIRIAVGQSLEGVIHGRAIAGAELLQQETCLAQSPEDGVPILIAVEMPLQRAVGLEGQLEPRPLEMHLRHPDRIVLHIEVEGLGRQHAVLDPAVRMALPARIGVDPQRLVGLHAAGPVLHQPIESLIEGDLDIVAVLGIGDPGDLDQIGHHAFAHALVDVFDAERVAAVLGRRAAMDLRAAHNAIHLVVDRRRTVRADELLVLAAELCRRAVGGAVQIGAIGDLALNRRPTRVRRHRLGIGADIFAMRPAMERSLTEFGRQRMLEKRLDLLRRLPFLREDRRPIELLADAFRAIIVADMIGGLEPGDREAASLSSRSGGNRKGNDGKSCRDRSDTAEIQVWRHDSLPFGRVSSRAGESRLRAYDSTKFGLYNCVHSRIRAVRDVGLPGAETRRAMSVIARRLRQ